MNFYVLKNEKKYDNIGNEGKGLYHNYVIEIEPPNKNKFYNCYISHTEIFYKELYSWETSRAIRLDSIDKINYNLVSPEECNFSDYLSIYQLMRFKEKL